MLSEIKTVEVLDALHYCNKYMIGIDKDRVKHFYKIKHGMLAHMYRKPKSISGYHADLDSIEIQQFYGHDFKLLSVLVTNDTYRTYTFHVPMSNKNIKAFDPAYFYSRYGNSIINELPIYPYESGGKEAGDEETWMKYYSILKTIAYSWNVINASEEEMIKLTRYPQKWKENWTSFVKEFNKRFKNQYIIRESETDKRKCEIVRYHDGRVMYDIFKFKMMKGQAYINYMNRINKNIKWH